MFAFMMVFSLSTNVKAIEKDQSKLIMRLRDKLIKFTKLWN